MLTLVNRLFQSQQLFLGAAAKRIVHAHYRINTLGCLWRFRERIKRV